MDSETVVHFAKPICIVALAIPAFKFTKTLVHLYKTEEFKALYNEIGMGGTNKTMMAIAKDTFTRMTPVADELWNK